MSGEAGPAVPVAHSVVDVAHASLVNVHAKNRTTFRGDELGVIWIIRQVNRSVIENNMITAIMAI